MEEIGIDIETYSSADLPSVGAYRYAEASDFALLLFCYAVDGGGVQCVDIARGEQLPRDILSALTDPTVRKTAFNATFERVCLSRWLGVDGYLDPAQWHCTMVRAAQVGLPLSLSACADALRLGEGKMKEGAALIRRFSKPDRKGQRVTADSDPEKWETFKAYCRRDVEVEQAILARVRRFEQPATERALYIADQRINDRGALVDVQFARSAASLDAEHKTALLEALRALTGLDNPASNVQMKQWIASVTGLHVESLAKGSLEDLQSRLTLWPKVTQALAIRQQLTKTSCKKYEAMLNCACRDGRVRGLLQYYGAARTGRWAGRLVQIQNLPQNHISDIDYARAVARGGDLEEMGLNFRDPSQVLSELIRTAFIASEGRTLHVCDFSAIEARVIAWLAGEEWALEVFRDGGDLYCATASQMFGVPVEKHGANAPLRQKGKVAVLALGYGGGVAALEAMGGKRLGLTEAEERTIVALWRRSNPRIVKLWQRVEEAATAAICTGAEVTVNRGVAFGRRAGMLTVTLPSGRVLYYPRARVEYDGEKSKNSIVYEGTNQVTRKWETVRTYGGKLTENLVQAIARDILGAVIMRADRRGMEIIFHIHDEVVVDAPPSVTLADVEALFDQPISWAPGLPLKGAGYSTPYYLKD